MTITKFKTNRVRRNYFGGKELDKLQDIKNPKDSARPEEWIASLVEATNKGLPEIKNEGISITTDETTFIEWIKENPLEMLGEQHVSSYGLSLGFLVKLLDSSMRLHTQAHPTREFAKERLNSDWGKFESYYVLDIRDDAEGYIRLGFQQAPEKEEWKEIIQKQDIERMDSLFEKVPIQKGDIVYIPGGVPHAIGEGVLLVEIMEPSDLVVRCEFEREGIILPEESRFMGKDLDYCLEVFDYTSYSVAAVKDNFFLEKEILQESKGLTLSKLIPASISRTFEVYSLDVAGQHEITLDDRFIVGLNLEDSVEIRDGETSIVVEKGESFFISSTTKSIELRTSGGNETELCIITNVLSK